jgi:outer membrane receptor for ferrienterochelin and colicin
VNLPQTSFLDSPFNSREYGSFSKSVAFPDTISRGFGINPLVFHNFSLFSQAYYTLKSFRFMGGARVDDNSRYGSSVSPRIAGLYILNRRTSLRGSAGLAFKSPPSSLSFQSLAFKTGQNRDSLIYLSVPNPGLKPEKYLAVELGIIKKYRKNININLSVYYNEIRNLITDMRVPVATLNLPLAVQRPGFDTVLVRSNSEKSLSRLYGMQGTMMINDIVKSIHLNAEVSLTFATASEKFPELFKMAGDYLGHVSNFSLIPKHFGQMKISFNPTRNLYIRATSIWQSSWLRLLIPFRDLYEKLFEDIDGYYCMDLVGNYRFGSNLNGFIKVNNLFDEKYGGTVYSGTKTPLPYNPQSGRFIQIGLTYTLN